MTWDGRSTVEMITSIGHQRRDVVVVGAGQAGLAVSWNLRLLGIDHAVLERDRVGESWRSARWDSFTLVTPAWMTRLPGLTQPPGTGAEFTTRDDLVAMLEAYSKQLPVRTGVEVTALQRAGRRYQLTTSEGVLTARAVVAATGALRRPVIPAMAARLPGTLLQLHAGQYRNPAALPPGAALVVGSGQSGAQIAEELAHAGRQVFLATSQVGRTPRRYRGRDAHDWAQELGLHDRSADQARPEERRAANPLLAGAHGGHTLALQQLARDGVVLLGRLVDVTGTTLRFSDSAAANLHYGDQAAAAFRRAVDEHIRRHHLPAGRPRSRRAALSAGPKPEQARHHGRRHHHRHLVCRIQPGHGLDRPAGARPHRGHNQSRRRHRHPGAVHARRTVAYSPRLGHPVRRRHRRQQHRPPPGRLPRSRVSRPAPDRGGRVAAPAGRLLIHTVL